MSGLRIAGLDVPAGQRREVYVDVPGTQLSLPCTLIAGAGDGPTVLVTAGVHCGEYVGIEAAMRLARILRSEDLKGNVVILPLVNRSGFAHRTMSVVWEDGKNLNRVFPGDPEGSTADRLAHALMENFIRRADACIDLHSGDGYEELTPYVYYVGGTSVEEASRAMARCVNVPWCVRSDCLTGGAYNVASAAGIPGILIERGGSGLWSESEVEADVADVCNVLRQLGALDGEAEAYAQEEFSTVIYAHAPVGGCWYPAKHAGDHLVRGELLGEIRDCFGKLLCACRAQARGILLYQTVSLALPEDSPMVAYGVIRETR